MSQLLNFLMLSTSTLSIKAELIVGISEYQASSVYYKNNIKDFFFQSIITKEKNILLTGHRKDNH